MTSPTSERIARRQAEEAVLKHTQLKRFSREVREAVLCLVNEHGIAYRVQKDGQHIFLYSGVRGERPCKVAASRSVPNQMSMLTTWVREHFPDLSL